MPSFVSVDESDAGGDTPIPGCGATPEDIVHAEPLPRGNGVTAGRPGDPGTGFAVTDGGRVANVRVTYATATEDSVSGEFAPPPDLWDACPKYVISPDPIVIDREGAGHPHPVRNLLSGDGFGG